MHTCTRNCRRIRIEIRTGCGLEEEEVKIFNQCRLYLTLFCSNEVSLKWMLLFFFWNGFLVLSQAHPPNKQIIVVLHFNFVSFPIKRFFLFFLVGRFPLDVRFSVMLINLFKRRSVYKCMCVVRRETLVNVVLDLRGIDWAWAMSILATAALNYAWGWVYALRPRQSDRCGLKRSKEGRL